MRVNKFCVGGEGKVRLVTVARFRIEEECNHFHLSRDQQSPRHDAPTFYLSANDDWPLNPVGAA